MRRESICCELPSIFSLVEFAAGCNRRWEARAYCLLYTKRDPAPTGGWRKVFPLYTGVYQCIVSPEDIDAMATLDHIIMKVNDLEASVAFYTGVLGFTAEGTDGPFAVLRAGPDFQIQMAPWVPWLRPLRIRSFEGRLRWHIQRIKAAGIAYGPTFDSVGGQYRTWRGIGGSGSSQRVLNDPNKHLLEIRTYER